MLLSAPAILMNMNDVNKNEYNDVENPLVEDSDLRARKPCMQNFTPKRDVDRLASPLLGLLQKVHSTLPGELRRKIYAELIAQSIFPLQKLSDPQAYVRDLQNHPIDFLDPEIVPQAIGAEITSQLFASSYFEPLYDGIGILDIRTLLAKPYLHGVVPLFCTRHIKISICGQQLSELDSHIPRLDRLSDRLEQHTYHTLRQCVEPLLSIAKKPSFTLEIRVENEMSIMRVECILEAVRGVVDAFREEDAVVRVESESSCLGRPTNLMLFFDLGWREWREVVRDG